MLANELGLHPLTAQLLLNRGITSRTAALRFLAPSLEGLEDPFRLPDMAPAVDRLRRAVMKQEPILIFGDSDVDGLTASVILYEVLREQGAVVRARQSNRIADGFGLPRAFARRIARSATKLLILVDCGTNQAEDVQFLAEHGIETIIVDHHVPLDGWARPYALINPHRAQGLGRPHASRVGTPFAHPADGGVPGLGRELCSAGLAFKVAQALLDGRVGGLAPYLDVASLGTLADCAPLLGENRIILTEGLPRVVRSHRPGLRRLCDATRTTEPDPEHILRRLTPRLNASGRLGDASAAWRLLLGERDQPFEEWMATTAAAHTATKGLHRRMIAEAQEQVNRLHFRDQLVMVVSSEGWHRGLVGPLAAQLAERYGRPAIAIAVEQHQGVGSGRSIPLFNLLEALRACQGLLVRFGGHAQACGLTVDRKNLEPFRTIVNRHAHESLGREGLIRTRVVDLELPLGAVAPQWVQEIERFAPFGQGNPRPTVMIRRLTVTLKSPRTAILSDGKTHVVGKGTFSACLSPACDVPGTALGSEGRYDVVASPALVEGELVLMVSEARGARPTANSPVSESAPWGPARTSDRRCTPEAV